MNENSNINAENYEQTPQNANKILIDELSHNDNDSLLPDGGADVVKINPNGNEKKISTEPATFDLDESRKHLNDDLKSVTSERAETDKQRKKNTIYSANRTYQEYQEKKKQNQKTANRVERAKIISSLIFHRAFRLNEMVVGASPQQNRLIFVAYFGFFALLFYGIVYSSISALSLSVLSYLLFGVSFILTCPPLWKLIQKYINAVNQEAKKAQKRIYNQLNGEKKSNEVDKEEPSDTIENNPKEKKLSSKTSFNFTELFFSKTSTISILLHHSQFLSDADVFERLQKALTKPTSLTLTQHLIRLIIASIVLTISYFLSFGSLTDVTTAAVLFFVSFMLVTYFNTQGHLFSTAFMAILFGIYFIQSNYYYINWSSVRSLESPQTVGEVTNYLYKFNRSFPSLRNDDIEIVKPVINTALSGYTFGEYSTFKFVVDFNIPLSKEVLLAIQAGRCTFICDKDKAIAINGKRYIQNLKEYNVYISKQLKDYAIAFFDHRLHTDPLPKPFDNRWFISNYSYLMQEELSKQPQWNRIFKADKVNVIVRDLTVTATRPLLNTNIERMK